MNFIFIGLEKHLVDGIAPRVGKRLIKEGHIKARNCFFCNGKNIDSTFEALNKRKTEIKVAVDVTNIKSKSDGILDRILYVDHGLTPASALKKQKVCLGNKGIMINTFDIYSEEEDNNWVSNLLKDTRSELIEKRVNVLEELLYYACIATIDASKREEVSKCIMNPMEEKTSQKS